MTHYKDEVPVQTTMDVVDRELEREAAEKSSSASAAPAKELKVLPVKISPAKSQSGAAGIVNAFRQKMSMTTIPISLPCLGRTVEFKEISAREQKELSKTAMENDSRADIMYCAMVNTINKLAVDPKFDIRDCSEFERIAVTLNLQQMNKLNPEIKYTCPKCGKENSYRLDTAKLLRNVNKSYRPDCAFEVESGSRKYGFSVGWTTVRNIEDFFKNYYRKYDSYGEKVKDTLNNLSQIEYITMFIKKVTVSEISDPEDTMTATLEEMTYPERVQIIDCLPQSVVFDDDTGIVNKVIETFMNPMNDCFKYNDCAFCGSEQAGTMASVTDFMGY